MNQFGLKKEIKKMVEQNKTVKEIQDYSFGKRDNAFSSSKRIENLNNLITSIMFKDTKEEIMELIK